MKLPKIIALFISLFSFLFAGNVFAATEPTNIYLSEFAANPEEGSEWVEIYNPTATPVDLTDWQIDDIEGGSSPFSIPAGTIIAPSEYLVFEIGTKLNNSGDSVRLLDNSGAVVDEFSYSGAKKGYSWARNANFDWQETMEQTPEEINVIVTPIPTPSPTPTSTPTLTPTPTVAPTPTPQTTLTIAFSPPKEAQIDQEFSLSVSLGNAGPNSSYYLKALIGETSDTSGMREGKTLSEDEQTFLAWNASWNKMPILQTNNNGVGERTIEIKTGENIVAGNYFLIIRTRKVDTTTNYDSEAKSFNVLASESEEPANTENAEESAEDAEAIFIAEAREMEDGEIVTIEGVVTVEPELLGSRTIYVEDESGGIKILLDTKNRSGIRLGNLVKITGKLGESFNERYIKMASIEFLGQGDLPDPPLIKTGEVDEEYEGELIAVNGQVTETSGAVFYLDDGSGGIKVYIKSSTQIEKPKMRTGYYSEVQGICSQYSDYYRILPRYQDDLLVSQNPIEQGSILGAVANLPETGFYINDFGLISLGIGLILRRLLK